MKYKHTPRRGFSISQPTAEGHFIYQTVSRKESGIVHVDVFDCAGELTAYSQTLVIDMKAMLGYWYGPLPGSAWQIEKSKHGQQCDCPVCIGECCVCPEDCGTCDEDGCWNCKRCHKQYD